MKLVLLFSTVIICSCQMTPTALKETTTNSLDPNTVYVDTRSAIEFETFHLSGSVALRTEDFLILKNPKSKKRILDPDLSQTIERLAKRGVSPVRKVVLVGESKSLDENLKWQWMFKKLGIERVQSVNLDEARKMRGSLVPQSNPEPQAVWAIENVVQKEILSQAESCFVSWISEKCRF